MMTAVQTVRRQYGRVNDITTTTAISHDRYGDGRTFIHVTTPLNSSEPTVQSGNAASTRQVRVSRTMTSLARRVVDSVATLSG